jgi:hypothetical protein
MKLKYLFLAQFVISLINGTSAVLAPTMWLTMYGFSTVTREMAVIGQLLGAGLLNYAIVAWFARNAPESNVRRAILLGFGITHAIGFVIATLAILSGVASSLAWMGAGLYLILALAYAYFLMKKEDS